MTKIFKTTIFFFLLALCLGYANSARLLDEELTPQTPLLDSGSVPEDPVQPVAPVVGPATTLPSGQIPATIIPTTTSNDNIAPVTDDSPPVIAPTADDPTTGTAPVATPVATTAAPAPVADDSSTVNAPVDDDPTTSTTPVATPVATIAAPSNGGAAVGTTTTTTGDHATLSFFMHDILGGSHPSGRVVTGVVANTDANGLPFSKLNNQIFPINGGVPLNTINGVINNNNYPFLVGLNGSPASTVLSNNGGSNNVVSGNNNQPFVTAGQLPAGLTLQQLMFGSVTVVDNEITEGHELDTAVLGRAQGFYLASSLDGSSHTLALTALFHGEEHGHENGIEDSISFFGIHRTATPISHLAIIGGTGKYENAKGHSTIETDLKHEDQHTTDGLETITHFTVYLTP